MLFASPFYMPVSWMVTLAWLGYLSLRLGSLSPSPPMWMSVVLVGLAGMITVPFYEELAGRAGWWHYAESVGSRTIGNTPLYVFVFEGAVCLLLPLIMSKLLQRSLGYAAVCGIMAGVWMPVTAFLAWISLGR